MRCSSEMGGRLGTAARQVARTRAGWPDPEQQFSPPRARLRLYVAAWIVVAFTFAAVGAEVTAARPTFHASILAASEAAAADKSLVLVILGGDWCPPCQAMRKNVLNGSEFLAKAGRLRIAEIDVQANPKAAEDFAAESFPTLVLMTAEGKIVARDTGARDTAQLLTWIEAGRERAQRGLWEGTAPGAALNEFIARAAADRISEPDVRKLVAMLGASDPGERVAAAKIIAGQRELAIPALVEALADRYLGVRIGASDLLRKLAPEAPVLDPWRAPEELAEPVTAVKKWWAQTGKLAPVADPAALDPSLKTSIVAALESLRGNDAARRTEGMSALVSFGDAALPSLRDAIKRAEKSGDLRMVALLEDVRWAILVPDAVEQRANVRAALARGTSPDRQAATARLATAGREALRALGELAGDSDPLVVENAVRSLSNVGGKDAIPAMSALLKSSDANLRMTAAQALGRSKSRDATKHLLGVMDDPNEVVACTALAALEEIYSRGESFGFGSFSTSSKDATPPEMVSGLKRALADARWRVRATAVEVSGKLQVKELATDLQARLEDSDGFVVKNALAALPLLGSAPEPEQLAAAAKRLPAIRGDVVRALTRSPSEDAVKVAIELFDSGDTDGRASILAALGQRERFDNSRLHKSWQPLIAKGIESTNAGLRQAAAALLCRVPPAVAVQLITPLLSETNVEARSLAAQSALELLSGKRSISASDEMAFGLDIDEESEPPAKVGQTNQPVVTAALRASWHVALNQGAAPDALVAAARFATAEGPADAQPLVAALHALEAASARRFAMSPALSLIVPRLRWPEGEPVLQALTRSPVAFAAAAGNAGKATNAVREFLLEPARFTRAVESARDEELEFAVTLLLGRRKSEWSLLDVTPPTRAVARRLAQSTNAVWRAAGLYALGRTADAAAPTLATEALRDGNPWVRVAAVQTLARGLQDRAALETQIGPVLGDTNAEVATVAACALLEPEIRAASMLAWHVDMFRFDKIHSGELPNMGDGDERPLVPMETKPAYLTAARDWLRRDVK
ncbi:MAG TPA: HEAT repeat domain-containing protein, partial [Opitutaceae bacterium]|nr:HEAT repeat domain-containing protein [Opitutaceae bacterium]